MSELCTRRLRQRHVVQMQPYCSLLLSHATVNSERRHEIYIFFCCYAWTLASNRSEPLITRIFPLTQPMDRGRV